VEIEFESGGTARLDEFTELEFTELALVNGARITALRLERGSAIFYANGEKRDVFEILANGQRVKVDRNARLRVDARDGNVLIAVLKGNVQVESDAGIRQLTKNQELRITADGAALARRGETDEFERWAQDREELLTASYETSRQYVNAPFRYGVSDLSNHGYWYYNSSYGYVWQPHAIGFTPYVNGNWIWANGFGWSWVGYEPWGWLPYHYGRWVWTGYGWAWVPGYFQQWSPAHVAWVRFGDGAIGWCPLSPRDRHGRRPHNLNVGTAVWNGGRPVVRDVNTAGLPTVTDRPTREVLGNEAGFGGRNPRSDRAGRGPHGRAPTESGTVAGPRSGFSGSANSVDVAPRAGSEGNDRVKGSRGDVRFDRGEDKYVNTPVRETEAEATAPRSGWGDSTGGRPRPSFTRSEETTTGTSVDRSGSSAGSTPRYGTTPRGEDSRGSGYSGRSPSSGQQSDRSSSAPPRAGAPQSAPSQQPRYSPPPRSSPPPQQQQRPSYQPPPRPASPPPQVRQAPPPRPPPQSPRQPN